MARLMVLGLLKTKPMTGYEMQQILSQSKTDTWAGILPGSIYHALKKMENEGLVVIDSIEQTGNRSKAIYKITSEGEGHFTELLQSALSASSVHLPSELYTALSFIDELGREEVLNCLRAQREIVVSQLELQKAGIQIKRQMMSVDSVVELLFQNLFKQYELQLELLDQLIETYEAVTQAEK